MTEPRSTNLYFTEGSSDKVFNVHLEQGDGGWRLRTEHGRRGKALRDTVKLSGAEYDAASKLYDKQVSEKVRKGYTEQEDGAVFSSAEMAGRATGFAPQLLNEISPEEARALGPDWFVQEKHDGERLGMIADADGRRFANRRGLEIGVMATIDEAFARLAEFSGPLTLDAENMGDHAVIFDVVSHGLMADGTFRERAALLHQMQKKILDAGLGEALIVDVPTPADAFFEQQEAGLRAGGAEGFVLRHEESLYAPGRPASGGQALKVKYWDDVTCRVAPGRDGKRSVGLELLDGQGDWARVGNVTVPQGKEIPETGSLVDVKYLYAYEGGSIYQPTLKGPRTDVDPSECRIDRLKFKAAAAPEADPGPTP